MTSLPPDLRPFVREALAQVRRRTALVVAGAACAAAGAWALAGGLGGRYALASVAAVASLGVGVGVFRASERTVRRTVERALQSYAAEVVRAHAIELNDTHRRLERSNEEFRHAQAQAEMLTQLIVHDLKSPLAVVLSNIGLAQEALAGNAALREAAEDLAIAEGEAVRLSGMIGDLLLVSRLERGELEGQLSSVRVGDVLEPVAKAAGGRAGTRRIELEVDVQADLAAWVDASLLRRLLENLVSNAFRYTPPGGRIQLAASAQDGRLLLAVRNTGAPVSAAARAQLFQKYATHGPLEPHNCGLGLYLCRLVAEAHRGRIGLADRDGWNVSFEVQLPVAPGSAPVDEARSGGNARSCLAASPWSSRGGTQRDSLT